MLYKITYISSVPIIKSREMDNIFVESKKPKTKKQIGNWFYKNFPDDVFLSIEELKLPKPNYILE
jgi:hypothetical protein